MAKQEQHFTAVVEISRVQPEALVFKDSYDKVGHVEPKRVTEVARVVLRDADVVNLLNRTTRHLDLLAETEGAD